MTAHRNPYVRKCTQKTWCSSMSARLQEANYRGKGLATCVVTTLPRTSRVVGVAYKRDADDSGLMLNFCPWCGARILWAKERGPRTILKSPKRVVRARGLR